LELDLKSRHLYWTDRGDNTLSRAPLDPKPGFDPAARTDRAILVKDVGEAIGIAIDEKTGRLYYTSLGGQLSTAKLNGKDARVLLTNPKALTGIALSTASH
jgi:sugar lactone lactonase YvrE